MFTTPDVRQVANWLRKALSGEPSKARPNQQTTHVEAFTEGQQDAGSIPAASTRWPLAFSEQVAIFMGNEGVFGVLQDVIAGSNPQYFR